MPCIPDCPICGGIGFLHRDLPITDPDFGRLLPCPNQPVHKSNLTGLSDSEYDLGWSQVIERANVEEAVFAVQTALKNGYGWVFMWGEYGLAKTLLLKIATAVSIQDKKEASYARMASILDNMRSAYDTQNPSLESEKRIDYWSDIPVLCIDEFDRVRKTEYSDERRFVLLDRRYESALNKKTITIMAANTDPKSLDGYLFDRIRDKRFVIVKLTGTSARPIIG